MPERAAANEPTFYFRRPKPAGTLAFVRIFLPDANQTLGKGGRIDHPSEFHPGWFEYIASRLVAIQSRGDNWDGYGARRISPEAVATATRLAVAIGAYFGGRQPRIVPTPGGSVQFEWHGNEGKLLEIEIEPNDSVHYLRWDPVTQFEDENVLHVSQESDLRSLASWFVDG